MLAVCSETNLQELQSFWTGVAPAARPMAMGPGRQMSRCVFFWVGSNCSSSGCSHFCFPTSAVPEPFLFPEEAALFVGLGMAFGSAFQLLAITSWHPSGHGGKTISPVIKVPFLGNPVARILLERQEGLGKTAGAIAADIGPTT